VITDHEHNAVQQLTAVQQEYDDKQREDIKNHAKLLDQLSHMITNHNTQIDSLMPPLSLLTATLQQHEENLDKRVKTVDKCDLKLLHDKMRVTNW
jgi:ABC-type transporter Mla subunit MlaD